MLLHHWGAGIIATQLVSTNSAVLRYLLKQERPDTSPQGVFECRFALQHGHSGSDVSVVQRAVGLTG